MNDLFNINRFTALVKQQVVFSKMTYLYMLAAVAGGVIVSAFMYSYIGISLANVILAAITLTILFGPVFFEKGITQYNGVFDFMCPVSTLEKLLGFFVKYMILFPVLLMGSLFVLVSLLKVVPVEEIRKFAYSFSFQVWSYKGIYGILTMQAIFLVGYLSFKKHAFIKTWLSLMLLIFLGSTLTTFCLYMLIGQTSFSSSMDLSMAGNFPNVGEDSIWFRLLDYTAIVVIPVGLWVVSYFKLREKEI
ncbi:MAG: hypothetical protein LUG96_08340 [Tannerellaceae bacterium]|nr:hypothetical protein [Tannerellaceae bacterium]